MILEYHKIDLPEERWTRTPDNFRRDLQRLWERGYRLVGLNDYLDGRIALPKGTTPVILTFDDSSPGQFRYLEKNGDWVVDPDCAVGILEQFEKDHPGFGRAATFFVLPGASPPNRLFNQPDLVGKKLAYLKSRGFEIGNHTLWHANLAKYDEPTVRKQLLEAQEWVQKHLPGYRFRTLALPMGAYPKELGWAISGGLNGSAYRHDAILMVAGGASLNVVPVRAKAGQHQHLIPVRRQRFQDRRKLEGAALPFRRPVLHGHPVRHVEGLEPVHRFRGGAPAQRQRGNHGLEERQRHRRAEPLQDGAPRQRFRGEKTHVRCLPDVSGPPTI